MRKNQNISAKITTYKFLVNGIKGFVLAAMPIIIIELEAMIVKKYSFDFIYKIISDTIAYGLIGIMISVAYTVSSKFYPQISRYSALVIIIVYYIYTAIFFIMSIYFQAIGPLFS